MARPFRFNRSYELIVEGITVRPPLRVSFSSEKSIAGGLNRLDIEIYNLREDSRLQLAKDPEEQRYIPIQFRAGYESSLEPLFRGSVFVGRNRREGADIVTSLECIDGGFDYQFSEVDRVVASGGDVVGEILKDMPHTGRGDIAERQQLIRPKVMVGRAPKIIDSIIDEGESWFIDNEQLHIVKDGEPIASFDPLVAPSTGLLETPEREQERVTAKTRFNPSVRIGGQFSLQSTLAPQMNGIYFVETISYEGDLEGDAWDQTITGLPP